MFIGARKEAWKWKLLSELVEVCEVLKDSKFLVQILARKGLCKSS